MDREKFLKHLMYTMFFIFLLDFLARIFFWYSLIPYFDVVMHFLGGFWVGLFFIYIFSWKSNVMKLTNLFTKTLLATMLVGVLWEVFEFYLNTVSLDSFNRADTLLDLFMDFTGYLASMFYFVKFILLDSFRKYSN